ncbi:MAG: glycosyltransferase [Bacteroidales bacterium]|nr:glycosyltransferase [Bacteroidales bacterium]
MRILYCSTLCSEKVLKNLSKNTGTSLLGLTVQKFHRLIVKGFVANGIETTALSVLPINNYGKVNKSVELQSDKEDFITYLYVRSISVPLIKYLITCLDFIRKILKFTNVHKDAVIICDPLNITQCFSLYIIRFFLPKIYAIVTDIPGLMVGESKYIVRLISSFHIHMISKFDGFVLLTKDMNNIINKSNKPYIIMEGLVDSSIIPESDVIDRERNIIYAGALHEEYGVKKLIDSFRMIPDKDICLSIYGAGPMDSLIVQLSKEDTRIRYYGLVPNKEVIKKEVTALLLINPRPSSYEFTKYSFPSKNMEYMASGTPLLTTKLPGMPDDYYEYVYTFEDETVYGMYLTILNTINLGINELIKKGRKSQQFVLSKKNNIVQTKRILELLVLNNI